MRAASNTDRAVPSGKGSPASGRRRGARPQAPAGHDTEASPAAGRIATLVVAVLRAETRSWTLGVAGAGALLMSYGVTGGHYDVARPDSMMLLLSLSGLAVLPWWTSAAR